MDKNILTIDIGNSHIVLGLFVDGHLTFTARSLTDRKRTSEDFAVTLIGIFSMNNRNLSEIGGSVISSVVPQASYSVISAIEHLTGKRPLIVSPKTAMINFDLDSPESVGSDRIASAVAAVRKYQKPLIILDLGTVATTSVGTDRITNPISTVKKYQKPLIILDLGTATTISVVNIEGSFIGGCIYPGVMTSLEALSGVAAQLPNIDISNPGPYIAGNTVDCMLSGIIYGTAAMLDGLIMGIEDELGVNAVIVATGGLAQYIIKYCKKTIVHDSNLLLEGLYHIYMNNEEFNKGV